MEIKFPTNKKLYQGSPIHHHVDHQVISNKQTPTLAVFAGRELLGDPPGGILLLLPLDLGPGPVRLGRIKLFQVSIKELETLGYE